MKTIIRMCIENNIDLAKSVRTFLKNRPKEAETGIYNGN